MVTLSLKSNMILRIVVPTAIAMLLCSIMSLVLLWTNIPDWSQRGQEHIVAEEENNLLIRTTNHANIAANFFSEIANEMTHMDRYMTGIYTDQFNITAFYPNYFAVSSVDPSQPPGGENTAGSVWFNKFDTDPTNNVHLANSSVMDNIWRALYTANQNYIGLYVGFESDGTFRYYPYTRFENYLTEPFRCADTGQQIIGYDPRCRPWYTLGTQNSSVVHFTEPYIDAATGNVLISAAKAVDIDSLLGVLSVDISIDAIAAFINSDRILDNGYVYLVDKQGQLIIYPDLDRDRVYTLEEREFSNSAEAQTFTNNVFSTVTNTVSGQLPFTKNGQQWLLSYSEVTTTDYIIMMVVPTNDIYKTTEDIESDSNSRLIGALFALLILTTICILVYLFTAVRVSNDVASGVNQISNVFTNVSQNKLDIELGDMDKKYNIKEVGQVCGLMRNLVDAIEFANMEIQKGNAEQAINKFEVIAKLMTEYDNMAGQGVVNNNLGYAYQLMEQFEEAERHMNNAIENAKELFEKEPEMNEAKRFFLIKMAMRYSGLGFIFMGQEDIERARTAFKKSCKLNDQADNPHGNVVALGNWGLLYMKNGKPKKAFAKYQAAFNIAKDRYDTDRTVQNTQALFQSYYNLAYYYKELEDYHQADQNLTLAATLANGGTQQLKCIALRCEILSSAGENERAEQLSLHFKLNNSGPKHIVFVVDRSGSMHGNRIQNCQTAIKTVIRDYTNDYDTMSLLTFNSNVHWDFKECPIGPTRAEIERAIDAIRVGSCTAFYDATLTAIRSVKKNNTANGDQWIVILTDGEDTVSRTKEDDLRKVCSRINRYGLNVIVIGAMIGKTTKRQLKKIAESSTKGMYIDAQNVDEIITAFETAGQVISSGGQMALENLL